MPGGTMNWRGAITLLWVVAIAACVGSGWTDGLLGLIALFLLELTLTVKREFAPTVITERIEPARVAQTGGGASGGRSITHAMRES